MSFSWLVGGITREGTINGKLRKRIQMEDTLFSHGRSLIVPEKYDAPSSPSLIQGSKWENLPPELLLDIIRRVEAGANWHATRDLVACAAVCRLLRDTTKQVVKTPEQCGLLTFPMSLKQPGPRDEPIQCFIKRDGAKSTYQLYLGLSPVQGGDASKLLLAAKKVRKATKTEFLISLTANGFSRASNTYVGKLSSNFLGTKFSVYDAQPCYNPVIKSTPKFSLKKVSPGVPPVVRSKVATISYELNVLRTKGPRRMQCTMISIPSTAVQEGGTAPTPPTFADHADEGPSPFPVSNGKSQELVSADKAERLESVLDKRDPLVLKNKAPRWHEQLQCWCLNFKGRVTVASVKNFQLAVHPSESRQATEQDDVILQFGKIGKDIFTMDYRYPLSAFQAFAICLSSFDTKPACE